MAEPGDPHTPDDLSAPSSRPEEGVRGSSLRPSWPRPVRDAASQDPAPHDVGHDDLIGFTSPASLAGSRRRVVAPAESVVADVPTTSEADADLFDPRPEPVVRPAFVPIQSQTQSQGPATGGDAIASRASDGAPSEQPIQASPVVPPRAEPTPAWAIETPREARPATARSEGFGRARTTAEGRRIPPNAPPEGAMGLYTVYALILCAVPTLGVAAIVALIAIYGRPRPKDALAQSHYVFQQRTVWIAAVTAVIGVLMIAVNLGVFVLFFVALWVLARGAAGLLRLSGGRPIENPWTWLL